MPQSSPALGPRPQPCPLTNFGFLKMSGFSKGRKSLTNGSVVTWGSPTWGADISLVKKQLSLANLSWSSTTTLTSMASRRSSQGSASLPQPNSGQTVILLLEYTRLQCRRMHSHRRSTCSAINNYPRATAKYKPGEHGFPSADLGGASLGGVVWERHVWKGPASDVAGRLEWQNRRHPHRRERLPCMGSLKPGCWQSQLVKSARFTKL